MGEDSKPRYSGPCLRQHPWPWAEVRRPEAEKQWRNSPRSLYTEGLPSFPRCPLIPPCLFSGCPRNTDLKLPVHAFGPLISSARLSIQSRHSSACNVDYFPELSSLPKPDRPLRQLERDQVHPSCLGLLQLLWAGEKEVPACSTNNSVVR